MYKYIKRVGDFLLALLALLCLFWIMALIAVLIKVESKGPVIFKQKRIGKNKKEFYIYKFRTMRIDAPKDMPTHLLTNPESFITKVGGFLRKTSLDELPQIFNILKGDMSIVGPRPALWNQYDLIELRDKNGANALVPGLTGWAQINGRDELEIEQKAELDGEYAEKISFLFDLKCFFMTFVCVLKKDGYAEGMSESINKKEKERSL